MSNGNTLDDEEQPAVPAAVNAVFEQQRRLIAELGRIQQDRPAPLGGTGPLEVLLCEVLASVGWRGDQQRILEAVPHFEPIRSVKMLRTVLARLGVSLVPIQRRPVDLGSEHLPCLITAGENDCRLLRTGAEGSIESYDLYEGAGPTPHRSNMTGMVYLVRKADAEEVAEALPKNFVGYTLHQMRGSIARIFGYSVAINIVSLALSLYTLLIYDVVIATQSLDTLVFLAVGALAMLVLEWRLRRARSAVIAYLAARFDGVVSVQTLASVLSMPLPQTERAPIASQLTRFRQFEIGRELFAGNLASALFDLPFTLLFAITLFLIAGVLGFVPIGSSLLIVIFCVLLAPASSTQIVRLGATKLKSDTLLLELIDKLRSLRNASAETIWLSRYSTALSAYQRARFANTHLSLCLQTVISGLVALAGTLTLGVGAFRVMEGAMSLGELIASMMIVWRILVPTQIVSLNLQRIKQTLTTAKQISDLSRIGNERRRETPVSESRRLNGNISAAGAYLSLGPQPEAQLRGVNLTVKAGEIVAITGPSGSGKSTLLKLILGLYPHYMGIVRLDGFDLRQLDPAEVRAAIGYASQHPTFFYGSIAANFRFACPNATDEHIIDALAAIGVRLPDPALPDGLATRISESEARSVSQGLLCRLSIARALVKQPPILLIDDLGNGLDRAGDEAFQAHLNVLRGECTVLFVTARPSHMRAADRVIEMRGGVITADGPPEIIVPKIIARMNDAA